MNSQKFSFYALSLLVCLSLVFTNGLSAQANMKSSAQGFIQNKGQVLTTKGERADNVLFQLGKPGVEVFILNDLGISFQFEKHYSRKISLVAGLADVPVIDSTETFRVNMHLKNANLNAALVLTDSSSDYINYYRPDLIQTRTFGTVIFKEVYKGIDWKIYTTNEGVKYDFIVHPGANPKDIQMVFSDQEKLFIDAEGSLIQECSLGSFIEKKPVSFQGDSFVETNFILRGNEVSFKVAGYDKSSDLIIDPDRIWATYFGGNAIDWGASTTTDLFSNVYLFGYTLSSMGLAESGPQMNFGGNSDFFLVKYSVDGDRLWSTYYGGEGWEWISSGRTCKVDSENNIVFVGVSISTTGIAYNAFQNYFAGGPYGDGVIAKFDENGNRLWVTYYGGDSSDGIYGCDIDKFDNIIVSGETASWNNIAYNGFQNNIGAGGESFLAKFSESGQRIWGTYFGGNGNDVSISCAVDSSGGVYLSGHGSNTELNCNIGFQTTSAGSTDAFLAKFNGDGAIQWATFFGGESVDASGSCVVSKNQKVYLVGYTSSVSNISFNGHQSALGGETDAFVAQFDVEGNRVWSTYYGGSASEGGGGPMGCSVDDNGNFYFCGNTGSPNNIAYNGFQNYVMGGDAFIAKFSDSGERIWGSYYGTISTDQCFGCSCDAQGNAYLAGMTQSQSGFTYNGFQNNFGGGECDAYLVKFQGSTPLSNPLHLGNDTIVCLGNTIQLNAGSGYSSYLWSNGATTSSINVSPTASAWYSCQITVENQTFSDSLFVTVNPNSVWFGDADGDGYGTIVNSVQGCIQPAGYVSNGTDCNDSQSLAYSGAFDYCENGIDEDCSGSDEICVPLNCNDFQITSSDSLICAGESVTLSIPQSAAGSQLLSLPSNLQQGLLGFWPFNGNANDISGNGQNGNVVGATLTADRFGNANSAYSFNGASNFIGVGSFGDPVNYSISLWVNQAVDAFTYPLGLSGGAGVGYGGSGPPCGLQPNRYFIYDAIGGCDGRIESSVTGLVNSWQYLTMVVEGNNTKMYLNGSLVADSSNLNLPGLLNVNIGKRSDNFSFFPGKIDDVFIYNRVLTSAEIQQIYNLNQGTCLWSNGEATASITVSPTATTTYTCTVTSNGITCVDSYTVQVINPSFSLGNELTLCGNVTYVLSAPSGYDSYSWSNGSTSQTTSVNQESNLSCTVSLQECTASSSVQIERLEVNVTASDSAICIGQSVSLNVATNAAVINPIGESLFNGQAYIEFPPTNLYGTTPRTISYRVKTTALNTMSMLSYGGPNDGPGLLDLGTNLNLSFGAGSGYCSNINQGISFFSSSHSVTFGKPITDNQWHTVTYVLGENNDFSFASMKAYVDGLLVSQGQNNIPFCGHNWGGWQHNTVNGPLFIGKPSIYNGYASKYNGGLKEIGMWSRALSSSEVLQLNASLPNTITNGLAHYFPLTSETAIDVVTGEIGQVSGNTPYQILWSNGATTATINVSPETTTTYYCTITSNGFSCTDSVTVVVNNQSFSLGSDVSLSALQTTLSAPAGFNTYLWNTGETTNSIVVSESGNYSCTVSIDECLLTDQVAVNFVFSPTVCQTIGAQSQLLFDLGYVVGPQNLNCGLNEHSESKWISVQGADSLIVETMQHRFWDSSKIYDSNNNLIWSWGGESADATWYVRNHSVYVGGSDSVKIEFYQGYPDPFCNGYLKVVRMKCNCLFPHVEIVSNPAANICVGDSVTLSIQNVLPVWVVSNPGNISEIDTVQLNYLWSTGDITPTIVVSPLVNSTYSCEVTTPYQTLSDSIVVAINPIETWYADADGDGYGNPSVTIQDCVQPAGYVSNTSDCNDSEPLAYFGAFDICENGIDEDCMFGDSICYCEISFSSIAEQQIINFSINNIDNSSSCSTLAPGVGSVIRSYGNYKGSVEPAILMRGLTINGSLTVGSCGELNNLSGAAVFIDFNQNGLYTDEGERVWNSGPSIDIPCIPSNTIDFSFLLQDSTFLGSTGLRVIISNELSGLDIEPCGFNEFGEAEDYNVNILAFCPNINQPGVYNAIGDLENISCGDNPTAFSVYSLGEFPIDGFMWFDEETGGNLLQFSPSNYFVTPPVNDTTTFYVASISGSCSSPRTPVVVNWIPAPPMVIISSSNAADCNTPLISTDLSTSPSFGNRTYWNGPGIISYGPPLGVGSWEEEEVEDPELYLQQPVPGIGPFLPNVTPGMNGLVNFSATVFNIAGYYTCRSTSNLSLIFGTLLDSLQASASISEQNPCDGSVIVEFDTKGSNILFNSDFENSSFIDDQVELCNDAIASDGKLQLTSSQVEQSGGFVVSNNSGFATNDIKVEFDLITSNGLNSSDNGFSYSYGPDVVCMPLSNGLASDNSIVNTDSSNVENGSGSGLRLSFDGFSNGVNLNGIYLSYNCPRINPSSTLSENDGMLFYSNSTSWNSGKTTHVNLEINEEGKLSMWLDSIQVITNYALPSAFFEGNKAAWKHVFSARNGSLEKGISIDNLKIEYPNVIEYSVDGGNTWSNESSILVSAPNEIHQLVRYKGRPDCFVDLGTEYLQQLPLAVARLEFPTDTLICGASGLLTAPTGFESYLWSTGSIADTIELTESGTYTCTITQGNCSKTDVVQVLLINPFINSNQNSEICLGESINLSVPLDISSIESNVIPENLSPDLLGYWPFNGNANDESENSYNGVVYNATLTTDRFGKPNSAYYFNGIDSRISTELSSFSGSSYSIALWYKTTNMIGQNSEMGLVVSRSDSSRNGIYFAKYAGAGEFLTAYSSNCVYENGNYYNLGYYNDPNWHFSVLTYDGETSKIYLDGSLVSSFDMNIQTCLSAPFIFGWDPIAQLSCYNGSLDDISIWNRKLTSEEISSLYNPAKINYQWSVGETDSEINVSPTFSSQYYCLVSQNGQTCYDEITINVNSPTLNLGNDTTTCAESVTLIAAEGFDSYLWNTGETLNSITVSSSGIYSCTVTQGECSATDYIDVTLIDATITASDTEICSGENITLSVGQVNSGVSTGSSALPTNLQSGLVGYWPFNGNANDESGNGHTYSGTISSFASDRFGSPNNAFDLSNQSDFIATNYDGVLGQNPRTVNLWFNVLDSGGNNPDFFGYGAGFGAGWNMLLINMHPTIDNSNSEIQYNPVVSYQSWHMFTVVYDSSFGSNTESCKLYIDGIQLTDVNSNYNGTQTLNTAVGNPVIFGIGGPSNALMDDVGMWDRVLSEQEIYNLYNQEQTTYSWSNGETTPTINVSPTETATYTCTVTTNGVSCSDSIIISVNNLAEEEEAYEVFVCGTSTVLSVVEGYESYLWNTGQTSTSILATSNGYYSCAISQGECTLMNYMSVYFIDSNIAASDTVICSGESVSLSLIESANTIYLWSTGETTASINVSPTETTTYTCSVTIPGFFSCADTLTVYVNNPTASITPNGVVEVCLGDSITLNGSGGGTYSWNTGESSQNISVNTEAVYTLTVTDEYGCSDSASQLVKVNPLPTATLTAASSTSLCQGQSVTLNATTNTGISYQWFKNQVAIAGATASFYVASTSGSYTVKVTNANGCSNTSAEKVVTVSPVPTASLSTTSPTTICSGNNAVLTANAGDGYAYQWQQNGNAITGATANAYAATTSGVYSVVVSNIYNCSATSSSITILVNASPVAVVTPSSTSICEGNSATLTANTGSGLSYQWYKNASVINGATASTYGATTAGSYTVTVTNNNNCQATSTASVIVVNPVPTATLTAQSTTSLCQGASVILNASTGAGYAYQWRLAGSPIANATSSSYTATAAGSYTVTVTNVFGCSATSAAIAVTVAALPTATITPNESTNLCQGSSVMLNANTGTGYAYQWQLNGTNIVGANSTGLAAFSSGYYTLVVTNIAGCSATSSSMTITISAPPVAIITAPVTTICQGSSALLSANTGSGLTYQWYKNTVAINGATGSTYTAIASGSYTVVVTNANGCSTTSAGTILTINVPPTSTITASSTTTICPGGSVVLNATPGSGYGYQWLLNGVELTNAVFSSYTATAAGAYTVVVTTPAGCSATSSATTVSVGAALTASVTAATATTFCQGGSVVLSSTTGTGYSYQWFNGANAISGATGSTYTATASGAYKVVVTNASGCTGTSNATTVTVTAAPTATITSPTTSICSGGSVVLTANTGTGFTYVWKRNGTNISGATASTYTATLTGSYTVVVSNGTSCSATSSAITLTSGTAPTATITSTATSFCQGNSLLLTANTGTGLTYQWKLNGTNITGATASTYSAAVGGSYTVVVSNASGCSATSAAKTLVMNALPTATITSATSAICAGASVVMTATTGTGYSYQWKLNGTNISGATSSSYTATAAGSYTVVVSISSGCSATSAAKVITVSALPTATITSSATSFCTGGSLVLTANSGTGFTYQWKLGGTNISGATAMTYTATAAGSYTVVVANASGCSATSAAKTLTVTALPAATISCATTSVCQGLTITMSANTGTGLTYVWKRNALTITGATASTYAANQTGAYTVTVTNSTGCSATSAAKNITVNAFPVASITSLVTVIPQGGNVVLTASAASGQTYQWKKNGTNISGATASTYTAAQVGTYTVLVGNSSGCSVTSNAIVLTLAPNPIVFDNDIAVVALSEEEPEPLETDLMNINDNTVALNALVNLYPNPTRSDLNVQVCEGLIGTDMYIFDALGKQLHKQQILSTNTSLSVETCANGNYIVRIGEVVKRFEVMK